jgi:hypothetical protein
LISTTYTLPVVMLAHAIRRYLEDLIPFASRGRELEGAHARFEAVVDAVAKRDQPQTALLLDELCRLREPEYLALAAAAPSESAGAAASDTSAR